MNFEYGCQVNNRYNFFLDKEDSDPSEIIAQAEKNTEKSKDAKTAKDAGKGGKVTKTGAKPTSAKDSKDAKDKKQPLQQQKDNSTSQQTRLDDRKDSGKQQGFRQNRPNQPPGDKENSDNKPPRAAYDPNRPREFRPRPPRGEGYNNNAGGTDNARPESSRGEFNNEDRPRRPRVFRPRFDEQKPNENQEVDAAAGGQQGDANRQPGDENRAGYYRNRPTGGYRGGSGRGGRGGYRGTANNFGPRRAGGPREFERHSGSDKTGIKPFDKKDGAGKSNWGSVNDEIAVNEEIVEAQPQEAAAGGAGENTGNWAEQVEEKEQTETEEAKEDVPNYLTLDEYKALRNEVLKKNQQFNIRKPGEGEDANRWGATVKLVKKEADEEEEEEEEGEEEEEEEEEEPEEDEKKKILEQIQIRFYEQPSRGRGGRGGRGGQRGDRRFDGERRERQPYERSERSERQPYERSERSERQPYERSERSERPQQQQSGEEKPAGEEKQQGSGAPAAGGERFGGDRFGGNRRGGRDNRDNRDDRPRGPRQDRNKDKEVNVPKIEDEKDFPSLSKA